MAELSVDTDPRTLAEGEDVRTLRRPREAGGATSRSVSPRLEGSDTRCSTPKEKEVLAESVPIPDGSDAAADGDPPLDGACGRLGGSQGGSIVGEGRGGRVEAEVGVSSGSAGGTLDSAGTGPSTSDSYVRVSETSCRADSMGGGTPQPGGVGLQCSWGMHTAGQVPACLFGASVRSASHLLEV